MPRPDHTQRDLPEHEQSPRERAIGFEHIIRELGYGASYKIARFRPEVDGKSSFAYPPDDPRIVDMQIPQRLQLPLK